jgi:hypothetical protein
MSQWHRDNPELMGTDADPWMQHESYRKALPYDLEQLRDDIRLCSDAALTPARDAENG